MERKALILSLLLGLLLGACGLEPPAQLSDREQTETAVAFEVFVQATLQAVIEQTKQAGGDVGSDASATGTDQEQSLPTATQAPNTPTPTPTETLDTRPLAYVLENTNCRSGPGTVFDILYIAMVGDILSIRSISTLADYVLTEIPGKPGQVCWLWTEFVELKGEYASLAVSTPPPTPTPVIDFKVVFDYVDSCVGWDPSFKLTNNGDVTFKSYYVNVKDSVTMMTQDHTADIFDKTGGCPIVQSIPKLDPGMNGWAYAYSFPYNPAGHAMTGSIKLCTGAGLSGTCVTKPLSFTP